MWKIDAWTGDLRSVKAGQRGIPAGREKCVCVTRWKEESSEHAQRCIPGLYDICKSAVQDPGYSGGRNPGEGTEERSAEYCRLLELVGLDETFLDRFPHELSGGQLQRVCIARAVACEPEFILFDEAISSLDAHTQVQVMDLLKELKEKLELTYVFITHDLTSVTYLCDEVMFLYKGRITEHIPVSRIAQTTDVYARKLLDSIIEFDEEYDDEMDVKESEESA